MAFTNKMKTEKECYEEELEFLESLYSGGYVPSRFKKIIQRKEKLKERLKK